MRLQQPYKISPIEFRMLCYVFMCVTVLAKSYPSMLYKQAQLHQTFEELKNLIKIHSKKPEAISDYFSRQTFKSSKQFIYIEAAWAMLSHQNCLLMHKTEGVVFNFSGTLKISDKLWL